MAIRQKHNIATWLSVIYLCLMASLISLLVHPTWSKICSDHANCGWLTLIEWSIIILGIVASQLFWTEATKEDSPPPSPPRPR